MGASIPCAPLWMSASALLRGGAVYPRGMSSRILGGLLSLVLIAAACDAQVTEEQGSGEASGSGGGGAGGAGGEWQGGGGGGVGGAFVGSGGAPDAMGVMDLPLAGGPCLDRPAVCDPGSGNPQQVAGSYLSSLVDKCEGWY